jgi:anti-sigma-K factor RskA
MTAPCPHRDDAASWALGAMPEAEGAAFAQHLAGCPDCQARVAALQPVVDVLPMAARQDAPPPELKDRIMAVVRSEAELLQASGPQADRVRAPSPERRRRGWWRRTFGALRPLPAAALATVLLAIGVTTGVLVSSAGDGGGSVVRGFGPQGASVALRVDDGHGRLELDGMPAPPGGRIYQVWLVRGAAGPVSAHALFSVAPDGRATIPIPQRLLPDDRILVTPEPMGGSVQPTSPPVAGATVT